MSTDWMKLKGTVMDRNGWANYWTNMVRLGDVPGSSKPAAVLATAHPDNPNLNHAINRLQGLLDKREHHPKEHGSNHPQHHEQKRKAYLSPNLGQTPRMGPQGSKGKAK